MDLFVDEKASSIKVIKLLLRHIVLIAVFSIVGLALGIGITFFIPQKFVAYAIIFPPNSNLGLNVLEDPRFGNSMDADQLMQLLESQQLKDTIIQMYRLEEYYGVDKTDRSWKQKLNKKYFRDIAFNKTRYYSVVITAKMEDPELSANIVNSIVDLVDVIRYRLIRQSQIAAFKYSEDLYFRQNQVVDSLKKVIYLKKDTTNPDNVLYNHLLENTKLNYINPISFVNTPEMESLVESYLFEQEKLKHLLGDYDKAKGLIKKPFSKVFILNKAEPNYKKVSPSFLLNAVIGFFSSLLFIILFVIVRDRFSEILKSLRE